MGALEYDELQFRVTGPAGDVLVDPATTGRYQGPFRGGDQDVLVYLRDDLGGSQLHCDASALRAGVVVSTGAADVTVVRGEMKTVEILMVGSGGDGGTGTGGTGGTGGSGVGTGGSGTGTGDSGGGTGGSSAGTGGSGAPPSDRSNGEACNVGSECVTGHCVDGVCCESDCTMGCRSCALPDSRGLCRPVSAGTADPRGKCSDKGPASCGTTGLCGVAGDCAFYPAGTMCAPAGCEGAKAESVVPAAFCDGVGKCEMPVKIKCAEHTTCVAGVCTDTQSGQP